MRDANSIQWKRLSVEAAAIVASILLAFAIDAWWEERQELLEEQAVLLSLLDQLSDIQAARAGREEYLTAMIESCRRLLEIAKESDTKTSDREIDMLLNDSTYVGGSSNMGAPVLESLFITGDISSIGDKNIRILLAELRNAIAIEDQYAEREVTFVDSRFYPYLDAHASIAQIYGADDGQPSAKATGLKQDQYPIGSELATESVISHRDLLSTREFQNILIQRITVLINLIGWERSIYDVDVSLQKTIDLLTKMLERDFAD
jgi:hypothetical protein